MPTIQPRYSSGMRRPEAFDDTSGMKFQLALEPRRRRAKRAGGVETARRIVAFEADIVYFPPARLPAPEQVRIAISMISSGGADLGLERRLAAAVSKPGASSPSTSHIARASRSPLPASCLAGTSRRCASNLLAIAIRRSSSTASFHTGSVTTRRAAEPPALEPDARLRASRNRLGCGCR